MLARAALGGIWVYQRYISPRKGFRCAHSVLHGDTGCSGYAKHAIRDHGLFAAIPLIRQRFRDCKAAYIALRERENRSENRGGRGRKARDCACEGCTGCGEVSLSGGCADALACGGRAALSPAKNCDSGCDICSCG